MKPRKGYPPRHNRPVRKSNPVGSVWITNPRQIDEGKFGTIYVGRYKERNGKTIRVAIKKFYENLTDSEAHAYQDVIKILRESRVHLPRMAMIRSNGEWVQVSQLFGSFTRPKIRGSFLFSKKQQNEMIIELTKIANAGLYPASDVMEPLIGISGGIIPIDIDIIALHYSKKRPVNWREIGLKIRKNIYDTVDSYRERKQLLQVARSIAREEIIPYLK